MSRQLRTRQRGSPSPSRSINNIFDNNFLKDLHTFHINITSPPPEVDSDTDQDWSPFFLKTRERGNVLAEASATEVEDDEVTDDDERIMIGSSDFSHAPCAIDKILGNSMWRRKRKRMRLVRSKKQNYSVYMYASAVQEQAPVFTVLVLPTSYGPPTNSALHLADDELVLFSSLGLIWERSKHNPRLFYLTKKPGLASISDEDQDNYEFTPFLPDLRKKKGKLVLDRVSFEFEDANDDIVTCTWDRTKDLDAFVNELFDDHFRPKVEVDEAATKAFLRRAIRDATASARAKKKAGHDFHFRNVSYDTKKKKMKATNTKWFVVTPVNSPTPIKHVPHLSGPCVATFFKKQCKEPTHVTHHFSLFPEKGLRSRVKLELENKFDFDRNLNWIHHILLFDFADAIQYHINSEPKLDLLVETDLDRLLDYIGINPKLQGSAQYFTRLIADCKEIISEVGCWPEHATDFLKAFLFRGLPRTRQLNSTCKVELPDKLRLNSSGTIEVQSSSSDDWVEIGLDALNRPDGDDEGFLSDEGTITLLLQLAYLPIETPVGIGAACFKQSLLLAPHIDESSKVEIRKHIPSCEESFSKIANLLKKEVQTVRIEPPPDGTPDLTEFALESKEMMIGVFFRGQRKHCVFINGEKGTISDPIPEYGQNEERSAETLKKLHINDGFHEVFVVKRIRLNSKKFRKLMNKRKNA